MLQQKQMLDEELESSASEIDNEEKEQDDLPEESAFKEKTNKQWKNRSRVLIVTARGSAPGFSHLVSDLVDLLPHSKKEAKVSKKTAIDDVLDLAEFQACNHLLYFEPRRSTDLYMWIGKYPHGPSAKFQVRGINISKEYKLTGNCLKGSRPILSFDKAFTESEDDVLKNRHLVLLKELFMHVFGTPQYHPKSKPFIDHVFSFKHLEDRIWFRNYQIMNGKDEKFTEIDQIEDMNLIEIGPRFNLLPIKILSGCISGKTIWQNAKYITPTKIRSKKFGKYKRHVRQKRQRKQILKESQLEVDELDNFAY